MKRQRGSGRSERDEQFHRFVVERRGQLLQTARLLTAGDSHLAEDLVQTTLTKLYISWGAYRRAANPDGYVRRALVNALISERRRPWWRFERPSERLPESGSARFAADETDPELADALRGLPARMRAAVVFRFFYDLSVEETAVALGCSTGTVKSQTSRALDKLRAAVSTPLHPVALSEQTRAGVGR